MINLMKKLLIKYVFLTIGISLFLIAVLQIINYNKIVFGIKMANLNIGGRNVNQAEASMLQYFSDLQGQEIILKYGEKEYPAKLEKLGITLSLKESLNLAVLIGHKNNFLLGLTEQIKALFGGYNLKPSFSFDENKFNNFIVENLPDIEKPAQNASLIFNSDTNDFNLIPSQRGKIINREILKKDFKKIGQFSSMSLVLIETEPEITDKSIGEAKDLALNILKNAPYNLNYNENLWPIDKKTLADWIEFIPSEKFLIISLNQDKIKNYLSKIAASINQEPTNAQLELQEGKANMFSLAKKGIKLDINKNAKKITEAILKNSFSDLSANLSAKALLRPSEASGEGGTSAEAFPPEADSSQRLTSLRLAQETLAEAKEEKIILETYEIEPEIITTEDINNFGVVSLLGKGESNFAGSPSNRVYNIKTGAAKMNGILLKPGQEFSFNDFLGEVGPEQGYLAELVIKRNKTIPEYGGGLCQVSTTIFRAAVNSGLKIIERYAHAFPVKYYNPQGFDATIYPPHPDIKFINDTPNHLLIQAKIKGTQLIFEFYGTDDGREIKIKGPIQYDKQSDGSIKAILTQEIWRNGQLERQSIFKSNYKSPDLYPIERNPLE